MIIPYYLSNLGMGGGGPPPGTAYGSSDPLAATPVLAAAPDPALARTSPESAAILSGSPDPALARTSPESATRLTSWRL